MTINYYIIAFIRFFLRKPEVPSFVDIIRIAIVSIEITFKDLIIFKKMRNNAIKSNNS